MLDVGDSKSWNQDKKELENALFTQLQRDKLIRAANDPESWIPEYPSEITEPQYREASSTTILIDELIAIFSSLIDLFRQMIFLFLEPIMQQSRSLERYVMTNRLIRSVLYGADSEVIIITVEDGLGNLYTQAPKR
jgi:hypothetical protein